MRLASSKLGNYVFRFLFLFGITLFHDLAKDVACTIGIIHVDVGTREIQLGRHLVRILEQTFTGIFPFAAGRVEGKLNGIGFLCLGDRWFRFRFRL